MDSIQASSSGVSGALDAPPPPPPPPPGGGGFLEAVDHRRKGGALRGPGRRRRLESPELWTEGEIWTNVSIRSRPRSCEVAVEGRALRSTGRTTRLDLRERTNRLLVRNTSIFSAPGVHTSTDPTEPEKWIRSRESDKVKEVVTAQNENPCCLRSSNSPQVFDNGASKVLIADARCEHASHF